MTNSLTRVWRYLEVKFAHNADSALRPIKTSSDVSGNFPYAGRNEPHP